MESVNSSLQEVSQAVQKLLQNSEQHQEPPKYSPVAFISSHLVKKPGISEGYRGESSFKAHAQQATTAFRDAVTNLELYATDSNFSATISATQRIQEATDSDEITSSVADTHSSSSQVEHLESENRSLPPLEPVLKLLRLTHTEKQRFFIDVPIY